MRNGLRPREIYLDFMNGLYSDAEASELILYLLNNSEDDSKRISSLKYLNLLPKKQNKLFSLLENLLVSDSNELIRGTSASLIIQHFPDKAYDLIAWSLQNEKSKYALKMIVESLINSPSQKLQTLLNQLDFVIYDDHVIFSSRHKKILHLNQKNIKNVSKIVGLNSFQDLKELYLQ
ncbi:MAG: hypothetical protein EU544_05320, partial [Promethearchaeota archaeon]